MKSKIFAGLVMFLFVGMVNAICEKELTQIDSNIRDYNTSVTARIDAYNKGDTGQACAILSPAGNVVDAYEHLARCYETEGNHSLAMETMATTEEWAQKSIEWGNKCGLNPEGHASSEYELLSGYYKELNELTKACKFCKESNKISPAAMGKVECKYYGCSEEDASSPDTSSSGDNGSGFPVVPIVGGLIVIVLIVAAFFLLKGKRRKAK